MKRFPLYFFLILFLLFLIPATSGYATTDTRPPTSVNASSGTFNPSTNQHLVVDDYPDTAPADTLTFGTATSTITFGFTAFSIPTGSTSISVQVMYRDDEAATGTNTIAGRLIVGGNTYNATTHNPSTTATNRSDNWANNPKSVTAWTVDDVNGVGTNALQFFGIHSTDSNPTFFITSIQLRVTYTRPILTGSAGAAGIAGATASSVQIVADNVIIESGGESQASISVLMADNLTLIAGDGGSGFISGGEIEGGIGQEEQGDPPSDGFGATAQAIFYPPVTAAAGTAISETNLGTFPSPSSFAAGSAVSDSASGNLNSSSTQSVASAVSEESTGKFPSSSSFPAASSTSNSNLGNLLSPCSFPVAGATSPNSLGAFLGGLSFAGCGKVGPVFGPDIVTNGGMEDGNPPTNWDQANYPETYERSGTQKSSGSYSCHVASAFNVRGMGQSNSSSIPLGIVASHTYKIGFWYYLVSGGLRLTISDGEQGNTYYTYSNTGAGTYVELTATFNGTVGIIGVVFTTINASEFYVDDVSIKEILEVGTRADLFSSFNYSTASALSESENATFISAFNFQIGALSVGSTGGAIAEILTFSTEGIVANAGLADFFSSSNYSVASGLSESGNMIFVSSFIFQIGAVSVGDSSGTFPDVLTYSTGGAIAQEPPGSIFNVAYIFLGYAQAQGGQTSPSGGFDTIAQGIFHPPVIVPVGGAFSNINISNQLALLSFLATSPFAATLPGAIEVSIALLASNAISGESLGIFPTSLVFLVGDKISGLPPLDQVYHILSQISVNNALISSPLVAFSSGNAITPVNLGSFPSSIAMSGTGGTSITLGGIYALALSLLAGGTDEGVSTGIFPSSISYPAGNSFSGINLANLNSPLGFSSGSLANSANLGAFLSSIGMSGGSGISGTLGGIYAFGLTFLASGTDGEISNGIFPSFASYLSGNSLSGNALVNVNSPLAFSSGGAISPTNLGTLLSSIGISGGGGYSGTLASIYTLALTFLAAGTGEGIHTANLPSSLSYLASNSFSGGNLANLSSPLVFSASNGISPASLGNFLASFNFSALGAALAQQGISTYALALALNALNQIGNIGTMNFPAPAIFSADNSLLGDSLGNFSSPVGFSALSEAGSLSLGTFPVSLNLPTWANFAGYHGIYFLILDFPVSGQIGIVLWTKPEKIYPNILDFEYRRFFPRRGR